MPCDAGFRRWKVIWRDACCAVYNPGNETKGLSALCASAIDAVTEERAK